MQVLPKTNCHKHYKLTLKICFNLMLCCALMVLHSCNEEEIDPKTACILNRIVYNGSGSLKFETVSGGRIYQMKEQSLNEQNEYKTLNTYPFKYNNEAVTILNLSETNSTKPFIQAEIKNKRPVKIIRFFAESGVTLTHFIDYSATDNIHVDVTWEGSDGTFRKYAYADYHLDNKDNVVRFEKYQYEPQDPSIEYLTDEKTYTYDNKVSPWKGLIFPFFATTTVTDIKFFSTNNILTIDDKIRKQHYEYQYNTNDRPVKLQSATAGLVEFVYLNCNN